MTIRMSHLPNKAWMLRIVQTILLILACLNANALYAGVREDIAKAKACYERGKLPQAAKILQRIVSKYPDNKAAYYLLGRVYYKAGQIKNASKAFKRSGHDFIDGGSGAFEYGVTMFAANDCTRAVKGFSKVSEDRQKDIASFYAGVCYFKMRNYFASERAMRRAKNIPDNFASTRRRILLEIQKRKHEERLGRAPQSVPYVPIPQMPQVAPYYAQPYGPQQPGLPAGPGAPKPEDYVEDSVEKKAEPAKPVQGLSFTLTPKVEYLYSTETKERHGHGESVETKQGPQGGGDFAATYRMAPDRKGEQVTFTLPLSLNVKNHQKSSKDVSYSQSDRLEGEILTDTTESNTNAKSLTLTVTPSVAVPVNQSIDIEAGVKHEEYLPDYKPDKMETETGGFGSVSVGISDVIVKGNAAMSEKEKLDADNAVISTTDQTFGAGLDATLPLSLSLSLTASMSTTSKPEYESLDGYASTQSFGGGLTRAWETFSVSSLVTQSTSEQPPTGPITGTADQTKFSGDVTKNFKLGVTIKLSGEYTMINQYIKTGLCTSSDGVIASEDTCKDNEKTAEATGTRTGYGLEVKFTPVEWVYASASYAAKQTVYAVKQADLTPDFQNKVTDNVESMSFLVGLSASF